MEKAEAVAESSDYSVGDGLARFEPRVVVVVVWAGVRTRGNRLHCQEK